jgi:hypothetical protein
MTVIHLFEDGCALSRIYVTTAGRRRKSPRFSNLRRALLWLILLAPFHLFKSPFWSCLTSFLVFFNSLKVGRNHQVQVDKIMWLLRSHTRFKRHKSGNSRVQNRQKMKRWKQKRVNRCFYDVGKF